MNAAASSDAPQWVNTSLTEGILHIELHRPGAGNAANLALACQLRDAVRQAADARVVLISAAGRAFMAGGDVQALQGDSAQLESIVAAMNQVVLGLVTCPAPVVCAVQGLAAGGGLALALSADLLIADASARFTVGSPAVGLSPDAGASWLLPRRVGLHKALEMGLLCSTLSAQEALQCGLVNEVAARGEAVHVARARAAQLATSAQQALRHTKALLRSSFANELSAHMEREMAALRACACSPDFREGVTALIEKRKPTFS